MLLNVAALGQGAGETKPATASNTLP
jgi:hypothetical protein